MRVQGAAAALARGHMDLDAVGRERVDGGVIQVREGDVVDASGHEGDFAAAFTNRGKYFSDLAEEKLFVDLRRNSVEIGNAEQFENAGFACQELQSRLLVDSPHSRDQAQ